MRKRIQQLAGGKFEYARPLLSFSTEKVDIEVAEGRDFTGDFVITSENHVPFRGIIYTSDARMECLTPQFEGEEVRIRYQFHSNGLAEGDIRKGEFFIICNQVEYNLSFVASVLGLYAKTSVGTIKNLNDFAKVARESKAEACHLFYSSNFKNIIKAQEARERILHEGLCGGAVSAQKVEEFLVGIRKKKPVTIAIAQESNEFFYHVTKSIRETVRLTKDQWGYVEIRVRSDAEFLVPERQILTEEDFIGSICDVPYYIEETALHAGKNYGRLFFEFPGQASGNRGETLSLFVCATRNGEERHSANPARREEKEGRARLLLLYMDYRLKKIVTGVWAKQTIEILDRLMALDPSVELYRLMKAQALLINRQRQEAVWIMDDYKRSCKNRETPEWGYYRYLCTLMERETSYVNRLTEEIETLFHKNPDSSLLFWILLFMRESYCRNPVKRLGAIKSWVMAGNRSPYLYLEAYYLIWQDPYLLGRLDSFGIHMLIWAVKQQAITKDIAMQVMQIVPEQRGYDRFVYRILEECYRVYPENEMLSVLCGYLIKGQCYETKYHHWYARGIAEELRITGLYEAYLMSLDKTGIESMPKTIQMYFQYDSALSYQQKALLYVNIIAGKERQPDVYQRYRKSMEQFAAEQMKAGHISDDLAVVYEEMLREGVLNEELAHDLAGILFTHKLSCPPGSISQAVIWHEELKEPQVVPVVNGTAYFSAYTNNYCVILCDNRENRFCSSLPYSDEALMHVDAYVKRCRAFAPDEFAYLVHRFGEKKNEISGMDEVFLLRLLQADEIKRNCKTEIVQELIRRSPAGMDVRSPVHVLFRYLKQEGTEFLTADVRRQLIGLLVEAGEYGWAYEMVQLYGYDYLEKNERVSLCSYAVTESGMEEDDFLIGFAESTFLLEAYNDVFVRYLCKYGSGSTKNMAKLWKVAREYQIDTFELEERILTQMLYTTDYIPDAGEIYGHYCTGDKNDLICLAYLSYFADSYLSQDGVVPENVFPQIEKRQLLGQELNTSCKLGLLKNLAQKSELSEQQMQIADALLDEYIEMNIYFEFYRNLPHRLVAKYHLYDKVCLEYRTVPGRQVLVHYRIGAREYGTGEMTEMYHGIYGKTFLLFFKESVQYYVTEEGRESLATESGCIDCDEACFDEEAGRYGKLNEILRAGTLGDIGILKNRMEEYDRLQSVTERAFTLL